MVLLQYSMVLCHAWGQFFSPCIERLPNYLSMSPALIIFQSWIAEPLKWVPQLSVCLGLGWCFHRRWHSICHVWGGGGRIRLHNENETRNSSTSIVAKYTLILTLSWEMALRLSTLLLLVSLSSLIFFCWLVYKKVAIATTMWHTNVWIHNFNPYSLCWYIHNYIMQIVLCDTWIILSLWGTWLAHLVLHAHTTLTMPSCPKRKKNITRHTVCTYYNVCA